MGRGEAEDNSRRRIARDFPDQSSVTAAIRESAMIRPSPDDQDRMRRLGSLPGRAVILMARLYQLTLSPLLGRQCRFVPSCSEYFIQAVRSRGAVRGSVMGIWRVLRCNPFSRGGYDPVGPRPDRRRDP